jgi:hypothetical protein
VIGTSGDCPTKHLVLLNLEIRTERLVYTGPKTQSPWRCSSEQCATGEVISERNGDGCLVEKEKSHRKRDLVSQRWADGTKATAIYRWCKPTTSLRSLDWARLSLRLDSRRYRKIRMAYGLLAL